MKTNIFFISTVSTLLIIVAHSCEEQKEPTLPSETQTGAHTLGCYVNGNLFVASSLKATYWYTGSSLGDMQLDVSVSAKNESLSFIIMNPEENLKQSMESVYYYKNKYSYWGDNVGSIIFTSLDTLNLIVSGTFEFDLSYHTPTLFPDKKPPQVKRVKITRGRFDIKMKYLPRHELR